MSNDYFSRQNLSQLFFRLLVGETFAENILRHISPDSTTTLNLGVLWFDSISPVKVEQSAWIDFLPIEGWQVLLYSSTNLFK